MFMVKNKGVRIFLILYITVWKMPVFGVFLVRMQENADQKNSEYRHILRSVFAITCSGAYFETIQHNIQYP